MDIERQRPVKIVAAVFVLVAVSAGAIAFNGFEVSRSEGTCYTTVRTCHGLPLNGCMGELSETTDFVEKGQCSQLENITQECRELKQEACSIDGDWKQNAQAYGRTCQSWDQRYGLDLGSC